MLSGAALRRVNLAQEASQLWDQLEEGGHGPVAIDLFSHYESEAMYSPQVDAWVEEENERRETDREPGARGPLSQREERRFRREAVQDGITAIGVAGWPSAVIRRFTDALREEVKDRGLRSWD